MAHDSWERASCIAPATAMQSQIISGVAENQQHLPSVNGE